MLLVGDASPTDKPGNAWGTATFHIPTTMNRFWGGDPQLATDNPYADLDDDQLPDLAVGRIPAKSADDLALALQKSLAYEQNHDFGPWRGRINFVAGEGGYGGLGDWLVESMAQKCIACGVPACYATTLTYANWHSPYCPDPHHFHQASIGRLNEGSLFWVFMGHGLPRTLQWAIFPDGDTPILQCEDCRQLRCQAPPIAVLFCCYAGAFAEPNDCLAEELLFAGGGPVAVISGSNVTMPYGMAALSRELMREHFVERQPTLGELLLSAKRDTMAGYEDPFWSLINALTVAMAPAGFHPKAERLEHLQLFNLLGDPTMPMRHPHAITVEAPTRASGGQEIEVQADSPVDGSCTLELVRPRAPMSAGGTRDTYDGSPTGRTQFTVAYELANEPQLMMSQAEIHNGRLAVRVRIPEQASGPCLLRVRVTGESDFALGSCDLYIDRATAE